MAHTAASDGALWRLFEKPLPESPSLLEVLAACGNHIHHKKQLLPAVDPASFTEIFGELHFHEKPEARFVLPPPPPPPHPAAAAPARGAATMVSWLDAADHQAAEKSKDDSSLDALLRPPKPASFTLKKSASFCLKKKSSASLLLCTEGLGSESTVDSDDMVRGDGGDAALVPGKEEATLADAGPGLLGGSKDREPPSFPPPIRSIGRGGKPCVCFRTFRTDGRFVLTQVVIPGKELLHASREGGRLRLRFANAAAADDDDDEDGEELELGDQEDPGHEADTRCMIGACA